MIFYVGIFHEYAGRVKDNQPTENKYQNAGPAWLYKQCPHSSLFAHMIADHFQIQKYNDILCLLSKSWKVTHCHVGHILLNNVRAKYFYREDIYQKMSVCSY